MVESSSQNLEKRRKIRLEGGYRSEQELAQFYISYICDSCNETKEIIIRGLTRIDSRTIHSRKIKCDCGAIYIMETILKPVRRMIPIPEDIDKMENPDYPDYPYEEIENKSVIFHIPLGYHTTCPTCDFNESKSLVGNTVGVKCLIGICDTVKETMEMLSKNPMVDQTKEYIKTLEQVKNSSNNKKEEQLVKNVGCPDCSTRIPLPIGLYNKRKARGKLKCSGCGKEQVELD